MKSNFLWVEEIKEILSDECIDIVARLLDPNPKTRITCEEFLECRWIKMDPSLVRPTKAEGEALESGYVRRNDIKPYKCPKFSLDTRNELKIWARDNTQWMSNKDLLRVQVNSEAPEKNRQRTKMFKNISDKTGRRSSSPEGKNTEPSDQTSSTGKRVNKMLELGDRIKDRFSEHAQNRSRQKSA